MRNALARLHKPDLKLHRDIRAASRSVRIRRTSAAEAAHTSAENVRKDIAQIHALETAREVSSAAVARVDARVTELVILRALFGIAQHLICFVDLLELSLRLGIVGVQIGVVLLGKLTVRLLYFCVRSALLQSQHLVIISFLCHNLVSLFKRQKLAPLASLHFGNTRLLAASAAATVLP